MKKAGWDPTTVRRHAVNVAEAMVKDLDALTHPSFVNKLDDILRIHGYKFSFVQFGIHGTRATIVRHKHVVRETEDDV